MEFGFTEEQEKLRKEVREFFLNELPEDFAPHVAMSSKEVQDFAMALQKKTGKTGYLTPGWSKESGGLGLGSIEQGIVNEEATYTGIRWPNSSGLHLAGPAMHLFGTEEQKRRFLPSMASGDVIWMEAFTEPDAGSDEANVGLRAVEDGDDFVLNGQKMFITGAYKPDYLYTLVRTSNVIPKHRGLSLFLVPGDTPGITFRPLKTMWITTRQNEIFFDDVRVPKDYLLGEINRGFYHAMEVFTFERSSTGGTADVMRNLMDFVQFCKEEQRNGKPLIEDPKVRDALAQLAVELEVWRLIAWQAQWWHGEREKLGPKTYDLAGFFTKTFVTRCAEVMMNIMGAYGLIKEGSKWLKFAGRIEGMWQTSRSLHAAGTIEIYKVVLAQRGLGLPRPPRPVAAKTEEKR